MTGADSVPTVLREHTLCSATRRVRHVLLVKPQVPVARRVYAHKGLILTTTHRRVRFVHPIRIPRTLEKQALMNAYVRQGMTSKIYKQRVHSVLATHTSQPCPTARVQTVLHMLSRRLEVRALPTASAISVILVWQAGRALCARRANIQIT